MLCKVTLEPYRVAGKKTTLGRGFCAPRFEQADAIVKGHVDAVGADTITWYHYNHINTSYYADTVTNEGMNPKDPALPDPFTHRAWGGSVAAPGT